MSPTAAKGLINFEVCPMDRNTELLCQNDLYSVYELCFLKRGVLLFKSLLDANKKDIKVYVLPILYWVCF